MQLIAFVSLLLIASTAMADPIPDLVCRETRIVFVDPRSLAVQTWESDTVYRFTSGSLYIRPSDRTEYLYSKVTEVELGRYASGHKVIQFEANPSKFSTVILVHTYRDEVRVSRAVCKRP